MCSSIVRGLSDISGDALVAGDSMPTRNSIQTLVDPWGTLAMDELEWIELEGLLFSGFLFLIYCIPLLTFFSLLLPPSARANVFDQSHSIDKAAPTAGTRLKLGSCCPWELCVCTPTRVSRALRRLRNGAYVPRAPELFVGRKAVDGLLRLGERQALVLLRRLWERTAHRPQRQ